MIAQNLNFLSLIFKKFKIPQDIITTHVWPLVSFPHQGRIENNTKLKNQCIRHLPKLTIFNGPKVIYNLKNAPNFKIKFVYCVYHSTKYKNRYITIHELINNLVPINQIERVDKDSWDTFTSVIRKTYYENINIPISNIIQQ